MESEQARAAGAERETESSLSTAVARDVVQAALCAFENMTLGGQTSFECESVVGCCSVRSLPGHPSSTVTFKTCWLHRASQPAATCSSSAALSMQYQFADRCVVLCKRASPHPQHDCLMRMFAWMHSRLISYRCRPGSSISHRALEQCDVQKGCMIGQKITSHLCMCLIAQAIECVFKELWLTTRTSGVPGRCNLGCCHMHPRGGSKSLELTSIC